MALGDGDEPALQAVTAYIAEQHKAAGAGSAGGAAPWPRAPPRTVPAAVLDARGAATADHARTAETMARMLTQGPQVCGSCVLISGRPACVSCAAGIVAGCDADSAALPGDNTVK